MPKLKKEDSQFLSKLDGQNLTNNDVKRLILIWQRNHNTRTTIFNASRWGGNHMGETMVLLNNIADILNSDARDITPAVAEKLAAVVKFHDESNSKSANTETSTTSQIIQALIKTKDVMPFMYEAPSVEKAKILSEQISPGYTRISGQILKAIAFAARSLPREFKKEYLRNRLNSFVRFLPLENFMRDNPLIRNDLSDSQLNELLALLGQYEDEFYFASLSGTLLKNTIRYKRIENPEEKNPDAEPIAVPGVVPKVQSPFFNIPRLFSLPEGLLNMAKYKNASLTYGLLREVETLEKKYSQSKFVSNIMKDIKGNLPDDEVIDFLIRDRLFRAEEIFTEQDGSSVEAELFNAIFSTSTMRSCITVGKNSSNGELIEILDEMLLSAKGAGIANINTFKFILKNPDVLDNHIGGIYWEMYNGTVWGFSKVQGAALHLETYNGDKTKMHATFRALITGIIKAYQKAKEHDRVNLFQDKIDYNNGNACIEGRMKGCGVLTWAAGLTDNKEISLVRLPTVNELLKEFTIKMKKKFGDSYIDDYDIYQHLDFFFVFLPSSEYYANYPKELIGKCKKDQTYAPEGNFESKYIAGYFANTFYAEYPSLKELVELHKSKVLNKLMESHQDDKDFSISATKLARSIYRELEREEKLFHESDSGSQPLTEEVIQLYLFEEGYTDEEGNDAFKGFVELLGYYHGQALGRLLDQDKDIDFPNVINDILLQLKLDHIEECAKDDFYCPTGEITADVIALWMLSSESLGYYNAPSPELEEEQDEMPNVMMRL